MGTYSGRERVLLAMRRRQPDRVPVVELGIDPAVIARAGLPCRSEAEFVEAAGLDNITETAFFQTVERYADGSFMDEWGCTYRDNREMALHPIRGPIRRPEDIRTFQPPSPEAPHRLGLLEEHVARFKGRKAVFFHCRVEFMWSVYLAGMENVLMWMALEPDAVHELFRKVTAAGLAVIRRACRAGADVISLGDDYCGNRGPLMSPAMFREFILPYFRQAVEAAHAEGALVLKHCDGYLWPILDDLVGTGIDGLNPLEPVAGMNIAEVKARYRDRLAIMGNVDCGGLLVNGTVADVRAAVRRCIRDGAPGGGYLLSSSNSIHSGVNAELYLAMIRAGREFGAYPLEATR